MRLPAASQQFELNFLRRCSGDQFVQPFRQSICPLRRLPSSPTSRAHPVFPRSVPLVQYARQWPGRVVRSHLRLQTICLPVADLLVAVRHRHLHCLRQMRIVQPSPIRSTPPRAIGPAQRCHWPPSQKSRSWLGHSLINARAEWHCRRVAPGPALSDELADDRLQCLGRDLRHPAPPVAATNR